MHNPDRLRVAEWFYLVVMWGVWNIFNFFNGPVSLFCLVRAVTRESVTNQAVRLQGRRRVPTNSGS